MFEGVHDKLPDITGYLNRLEINEALEPTKENLDKLVYAHLTHIPYENLEYCIEKSCPDLTIGGLYNKLVERKRGGYCFELNGLFYALLKELGYDVYPVACRMWIGLGQLPIGHRASIVTINGKKYFADVGTSGTAGLKSVPFDCVTDDGVYITINGPETEVRKKTEESDEALISFVDSYFDPIDFVPLNYYCAMGPAAADRPDPVVSITTENGAYSINADIFKIHKNGVTEEIIIENREMLFEILEKYFGIVI